jgi:hypothetical protein
MVPIIVVDLVFAKLEEQFGVLRKCVDVKLLVYSTFTIVLEK